MITGFGRLGTWFGSEFFDVRPDLITFAKAVTSGYIPLGGVVVGPKVVAALEANPGFVLKHGYTYSGHPIASVAASTAIEIIEDEGSLERSPSSAHDSNKACGAWPTTDSSPNPGERGPSGRSVYLSTSTRVRPAPRCSSAGSSFGPSQPVWPSARRSSPPKRRSITSSTASSPCWPPLTETGRLAIQTTDLSRVHGWCRYQGISSGGSGVCPKIRSAAFSAIIITGA